MSKTALATNSHHPITTYTHSPILQKFHAKFQKEAGQIGKKQERDIGSQLQPLPYTALTWYNHDKYCKNRHDRIKTWALRIQTPPLCLRRSWCESYLGMLPKF